MIMKHREATLSLDEAEWNLDAAKPDDELQACFFYEYAREIAKNSPHWPSPAAAGPLNEAPRNGGLDQLDTWEVISRRASLFAHLQLPVALVGLICLDALPTIPWAKVTAERRQKAASALEKSRTTFTDWPEPICLKITLERDLEEYKDCGVKDFLGWRMLDLCFHLGRAEHQREYGFLAINWSHTDEQLKAKFAKFLNEKRGDRKDSKSKKGTNKMRQHLRALGAKRLLEAGFTAEVAIKYTGRIRKDCKPLYEAPRSWYQAKRKVANIIRLQFAPR